MIEQLYHSLLPSLEHFHSLAYWAAFVAALAETALVVGLLVPGSTLLLLLGALTATGQVDFAGVFWFGVAGAVLGDNLNYWLGKRYGQRWLKAGVWFLRPEHFAQAHEFFDRNGAKSVFLGRFIPSIKEIAPFVAGSVGMHQGTFLFWNLLGGVGWGLQWIGGGYLFGQSLALAQAWMSRIGLLFLGILLVWLLLWYLKRVLTRQGPQIWLLLVSLSRSVASALSANPYVRQFKRRHPRWIGFLSARVDRSHFCGLPLTLLTLTLFYIAMLFGGIVEDIMTSDPIVAVDQAVAQLVARFRPPEVQPFFTWITALGLSRVAGPLLLLGLIGAWLAKGRWLAVALLTSAGGTALFTALGKLAFHRPRPVEAVLLETSYSFPSGHASIAAGLFGFIGYALMRTAPDLRSRVNWLLVTLLVVVLIGLSRIALGVHYLSDVWAGYLVGAGWLVIGIAVSEWATANAWIDWRAPVRARRQRLLWLVAAGCLAWYVSYAALWHPKPFTPPPVLPKVLNEPLVDLIRQEKLDHTETLLGAPSQPLSVAFIAPDEASLVQRLEGSGWQKSDSPTPGNLLKLLREGLGYTATPLAPVFWNRRINDLGFGHGVTVEGDKVVDTLRLWKTPWLIQGAPVYVGAARAYTGTYWGLLHRIAPDTDAATQRLVQSLPTGAGGLPSCEEKLGKAEIGTYLLGMEYFSSGQFALVDLRGGVSSEICHPSGSQR
ncbi:MAG: VTT domain-containing protein [Sedimenticolaceae bacterium]